MILEHGLEKNRHIKIMEELKIHVTTEGLMHLLYLAPLHFKKLLGGAAVTDRNISTTTNSGDRKIENQF